MHTCLQTNQCTTCMKRGFHGCNLAEFPGNVAACPFRRNTCSYFVAPHQSACFHHNLYPAATPCCCDLFSCDHRVHAQDFETFAPNYHNQYPERSCCACEFDATFGCWPPHHEPHLAIETAPAPAADAAVPALPKPKPYVSSPRPRTSLAAPVCLSSPRSPPIDSARAGAQSQRARSVDTAAVLKKPEPLYKVPSPPPARQTQSACGHQNAGQELCYLCHQREARNIPVHFAEERRMREKEEERLLRQYQQMKDTEAILKTQVSQTRSLSL